MLFTSKTFAAIPRTLSWTHEQCEGCMFSIINGVEGCLAHVVSRFHPALANIKDCVHLRHLRQFSSKYSHEKVHICHCNCGLMQFY